MRPVVPGSLDGLAVIAGAPLSAIVGAPLVCVPVLETVVFPSAVMVVSLFPWIYPLGFL